MKSQNSKNEIILLENRILPHYEKERMDRFEEECVLGNTKIYYFTRFGCGYM